MSGTSSIQALQKLIFRETCDRGSSFLLHVRVYSQKRFPERIYNLYYNLHYIYVNNAF